MTTSSDLFKRAQKCIPGGVNSPGARLPRRGRRPGLLRARRGRLCLRRRRQALHRLRRLLGADDPRATPTRRSSRRCSERRRARASASARRPSSRSSMAELVCQLVPSIEMVRMVSSGTEATMSAIRLARGFTGRDKIVKFEGCYHGHADSLLVKAGSGALTLGVPDLARRPRGPGRATPSRSNYNDVAQVRELFARHRRRNRLHHRRAGGRQHELHPAGAGLPGRAARGLRPARRPADLRRGHDRLPRRPRRCAGALRHPART